MCTKWFVAMLVALATAGSVSVGVARADLPPPPGVTRVSYAFRVTGSANGVVLVAYPMSNSAGGDVLPIGFDQELRPVQGFVPGIYAVGADVLPTIVGKSSWKDKEGAEIAAVLAARGRVCVKAVPRVFTVPSSTAITSVVDVFRVDANTLGCRAAFLTTFYGGARGEAGQGFIDPAGQRVPPPPFGRELPPVGDIGVAYGAPAPAPSRGSRGCGSCEVSSADTAPVAVGAALLGVAVAVARSARRARRSGSRSEGSPWRRAKARPA